MTLRIVLGSILLVAATMASAQEATSAKPVRQAAPAGYYKPRAPVRIEWLETMSDTRLAAVVRPDEDYERLEIILVLPGAGEPRRRQIHAAGTAGSSLEVAWDVPAGAASARILVLMQTGGRLMKRASTPPGVELEEVERRRRGGPGRIDRDAGLRVLPAAPD